MAYVVTEACIRCKYMDCVAVCPVDCFYEGENMLVIHPDECIDCGQCEPECPVQAITAETDLKATHWLAVNRLFATRWRGITQKGLAPQDADRWRTDVGKARYLSTRCGCGNELPTNGGFCCERVRITAEAAGKTKG